MLTETSYVELVLEAPAAQVLETLCAARLGMNRGWAQSPPPLHLVLEQMEDRGELLARSRALLEVGAHPRRRYRMRWPPARQAATAAGKSELVALYDAELAQHGPAQLRTARERGIKDIVLCYDKADGLVYRVADRDLCLFRGGDYDGALPLRRGELPSAWRQLSRFLQERVAAFESWVDPIARDEDIDLDRVLAQGWRVIREDALANWE